MFYQTFTTAKAAQAAVAQHRADGFRAYVVCLSADRYEVRSWGQS